MLTRETTTCILKKKSNAEKKDEFIHDDSHAKYFSYSSRDDA